MQPKTPFMGVECTKTLTLNTPLENAYVLVAQTLVKHEARITEQHAPHSLGFVLKHSSTWTGFAELGLQGQAELDGKHSQQTRLRIRMSSPDPNPPDPNTSQQVFTTVFGQVFLTPLLLYIVANASASDLEQQEQTPSIAKNHKGERT